MGRFRYLAGCLCLLLAAAVSCKYGTDILYARSAVSGMGVADLEGEDFRKQELDLRLVGQLQELGNAQGNEGLADILAATMLMGRFHPERLYTEAPLVKLFKKTLWEESRKSYQAVWGDLECFPVLAGEVSYENSWLSPRGNQGERQHEGCDLFGPADRPGYYPVASMTRGTVEQVGWLPLGGYRIGVRSPGGGYFYYAHLDSYEREFQVGDWVRPGQVLGFMGNTGYGPEGTRGEFTTHLHLGIYIQTPRCPELSVNPYWVLRYLEK